MMKATALIAALALACVGVTTAEAKPKRVVSSIETTAVVGSQPAGCPRRFCGCALSIKIFNRIIPRLNLAANWLAFPRTTPTPGMVAARRGHALMLKHQIKGKTWFVWDPNSGGGKIRLHARSIAGFAIVNPHGSRLGLR